VPWTEHTITPIGSTGKALASTALLILADRGLVDLDEPVASYWPAFGQNGKAEIPVRLVLSHRSGVAALDVPISDDQAGALDPVLRLIEQQRLWWRPGAKHGYHAARVGRGHGSDCRCDRTSPRFGDGQGLTPERRFRQQPGIRPANRTAAGDIEPLAV
jgi:Beta-lactamase